MEIGINERFKAGESILMPSGEMIKTLRVLKELSQLELANLAGISQKNLSAIEDGCIDLSKATSIVLARALNVHPSAIMFSDYKSK